MSTLPWELCFWVAVSLPRRGKWTHPNIQMSFLCCCHEWQECKNEHFCSETGVGLFWLYVPMVCVNVFLKILYVFESPELIENVKLIHKPVSLQPRGLINKGNWCYINAVSFHSSVFPLISPDFHFFSNVHRLFVLLPDSEHPDATGSDRMSTDVSPDEVYPSAEWRAEAMHLHTHDGQFVSNITSCEQINYRASAWKSQFYFSASVRLVNEFNNMPVPSKAKQQGKEIVLLYLLYSFLSEMAIMCFQSIAVGDKMMKDIRPGVPFEPTYIYKLLTLIKSSLSEKVSLLPVTVNGCR